MSLKYLTRSVFAALAVVYLVGRVLPQSAHAQDGAPVPQQRPVAEATIGESTTIGEASVGSLVVSGGFARATLPNQPAGAVYLTVTNTAADADRLIGATSPAAGAIEVHQMTMDGDVMRMAEQPDGIAIPAGGEVTLQPGGIHLMLLDLAAPLVEAGTVELTLEFETAGAVTLTVPVTSAGATMAPTAGM